MNKPILPTLTFNNFLSDIDKMLKQIYYYYVVSDYEQSITFFGKVKSLDYSLKKANYDPDESEKIVYEDFYFILSNYWDNVTLDVTSTKKPTGTDKFIYVINIDVTIKDSNGRNHTLNKSIAIDKNKNIRFNDGLDYLSSYLNY